MSRRCRTLVLAGALALLAAPSLAHGPTVTVSVDGARPEELRIERGETVHFTNEGSLALRLRGEEDSFRSPVLAPGAGWHLPFPFPGRFPYRVERAEAGEDGGGEPLARGAIAVGDPG